MAFMEPQVEQGQWYAIETDGGTWWVPSDVLTVPCVRLDDEGPASEHNTSEGEWESILSAVRDFCEGTPYHVSLVSGWGARFSAPGYMDCTEWSVFDTEKEARDYLLDQMDENEISESGWDQVDTSTD